jgi:hypothetical protein
MNEIQTRQQQNKKPTNLPNSLKDFNSSEEIGLDDVRVGPVVDQVNLTEVHGKRSRDRIFAVGHNL